MPDREEGLRQRNNRPTSDYRSIVPDREEGLRQRENRPTSAYRSTVTDREEGLRQRENRPFFFLPNSVESQQQSLHCAVPCGLAAASDVEAERERCVCVCVCGGGGGLMRLDSDQITMLHTDGSPTTPPRFALSVRHRVPAHTVAAHRSMHSISPYLGLTLVKSHFLRIGRHGRHLGDVKLHQV